MRSPTESAERYVAGRMTEDEEREFEVAMLEQPELTAEVDARQRIKAGLQHLDRLGELDKLVAGPPRRRFVPLALAASVLLLMLAGLAYWKLGDKAGISGRHE